MASWIYPSSLLSDLLRPIAFKVTKNSWSFLSPILLVSTWFRKIYQGDSWFLSDWKSQSYRQGLKFEKYHRRKQWETIALAFMKLPVELHLLKTVPAIVYSSCKFTLIQDVIYSLSFNKL